MDSHESIQAAMANLTDAIEKAQESPVRLFKLLTNVYLHWSEEKTSESLGSLSDVELLQKLASSGSVAAALDTRETRKQGRRVAARVEFFNRLRETGGILKSQGVVEVLGMTRQTVNNHVKKGSLIAIQEANDYLYPVFQFHGDKKLPHLEEILALLNDVSAEAKCTFFLNSISFGGDKVELPYIVLRDGATEKQLATIKREASLFMSSTPA